jgi:hypothetical protein
MSINESCKREKGVSSRGAPKESVAGKKHGTVTDFRTRHAVPTSSKANTGTKFNKVMKLGMENVDGGVPP